MTIPAISPLDFISAGRWNEALFTSYALSLSFFEAAPLHALRRAGCRSVSILVDAEGYRASLSEVGIGQAGRSYEIAPLIFRGGIFHPKILLLTGDDGLRAGIGSGNLTFNGWGNNLELIEYLTPSQAPDAFTDLAEFLEVLSTDERVTSESLPGVDSFVRFCRTAGRQTGDGRLRVLHSLRQPIANQLVNSANDLGGAVSLTIVSPYFGTADAVISLASALNIEEVSICVPVSAAEFFPFDAATKSGIHFKPVIAATFEDRKRKLHAKAIDILCRQGRLIVTGSANATRPALVELGNVEVSVLQITDVADVFGWEPTENFKGQLSGGYPPQSLRKPILIARIEGEQIKGRVLSTSDFGSKWHGVLISEGQEYQLGPVEMIANGEFTAQLSAQTVHVWGLRGTIQLLLHNDKQEVRGWIMLGALLGAIRERGPIAETLIRLVSGSEDPSDLAAVLEFFIQNPDALLNAQTHRHGTSNKKDGAPEPSGFVSIKELVPTDVHGIASGDMSPDGKGPSGSAFEQLLMRWYQRVEEQPEPYDSSEIEEDEEENGQKSKAKSGRKNKPITRTVPTSLFDRVVDAFENHASLRTYNHPATRNYLVVLLDFGLFITRRTEEPGTARALFLQRWQSLSRKFTAASNPPDELDKAIVQVLVAGVISDPARASSALATLQRHIGGHVTETWAAIVAPLPDSPRAGALDRQAAKTDWRIAFDRVRAAVTPWMEAEATWRAIQEGHDLPGDLSFLSQPEGKTLQDVAARRLPLNDVLAVTLQQYELPACPRCNRVLPTSEIYRFRSLHIATALACCRRVILNLIP